MRGRPKVVVVVGPTSSGKSNLAVEIAQACNGEIISADSRQVYRGMNIGSGKVPISYEPNGESKKSGIRKMPRRGKATYYRNIRHHLLDVASPKRTFTVAQYQQHAQRALRTIIKRGKLPIICGGTGMYIDAVIYNYQFPPVPPQPQLRKKLDRMSTHKLIALLSAQDPERAAHIDVHNRRRLIRALEIIQVTGQQVTKLHTTSPYHTLWIGIHIPRKTLVRRIATRLRTRIKEGMIREVEQLHQSGISWHRLESFGLEYRYITQYLQKKFTKDVMVAELERAICRYAKRQMTWFKKNRNIHWIDTAQEAISLTRQSIVSKQ